MKPKKQFHPCLKKWRARIDEAEKRGGFTQLDESDSGRWTMCAIGESRNAYPALFSGDGMRPLDHPLAKLGERFGSCVAWGSTDFPAARRIIGRIEERLIQLHEENTNAR